MILFVSLSPTHSKFFQDARRTLPAGIECREVQLFEVSKLSSISKAARTIAYWFLLAVTVQAYVFLDRFPLVRFRQRVASFFLDELARATVVQAETATPKLSRSLLVVPILTLVRSLKVLRRFEAYLENEEARLVVFPDDSTYGATLHLIEACKKQQVRTMVLPFTNGVDQEYIVDAITATGTNKLQRRLAKIVFPEYVFVHSGGGVLSFPLHAVLNAAYFGVSAGQLWGNHCDVADSYSYTDETSFEHALSLTTDPKKIFLIEPPQATAVYTLSPNRSTRRTSTPGRVASRCRKVLVLVPPDQFPIRCSFKSYDGLLRAYLEPLTAVLSDNLELLISRHPRHSPTTSSDRAKISLDYTVVNSVVDGLAEAEAVVSYGSSLNSCIEYLELPLLTYNVYDLENMTPSNPGPNTLVATHDTFPQLLKEWLSGGLQRRLSNRARRPSLASRLILELKAGT